MLEACEGDSTLKLLEKRITSHPEFFNPEALARNEVELINASGEALRPDRVIIQGNQVTIVDYKFGKPQDEYKDQVGGYMDLYRQLGYKDIRGFLWYVYTDKVVEVEG